MSARDTLEAVAKHSGLNVLTLRNAMGRRCDGLRQLERAGLIEWRWYNEWDGGFFITVRGLRELGIEPAVPPPQPPRSRLSYLHDRSDG